MAIEPMDLIIIALFSGFGNALGQALAGWFKEKFNHHKKELDKIINTIKPPIP